MEATKSAKDYLVSIAMTLHNNDGEYVKSDEEPTDWRCRQRALVKKASFHENVESRCDCRKGLNWRFNCKSKFQCLALGREISLANASPALTYAKLAVGD